MKRIIPVLSAALGVVGLAPTLVQAQTAATVRVPQCLQYPDTKTYAPCTGIVPVDPMSGNVISWSSAFPSGGGGSGGSTTVTTTSTAAAPNQTEGSTNNPLSTDNHGYLRTRNIQDGAWSVGITGTVPVTGTFYQTTQPVSATSLPLPTGAATASGVSAVVTALGTPFQAGGSIANTSFGVSSLPALPAGSNTIGSVNINGSVPVTGSFYQATQPVSAASLPLPSGAATAANQTTANSTLATLATAAQLPASLGQKTMATSLAVALSSDGTYARGTDISALQTQLHTDLTSPTPAGTAIIGKVGIDQTTPGTTNGVVVNSSALPTGAATATAQTTLIAQTKSTSQSSTSASTTVNAAVANTLLLAANAARLGGTIVNDSTSVLYIKLSTGASSTVYDYYIAGSTSGIPSQFEIPQNWIGPLYGYWATATGVAHVSERTP